MDFPTRFDPKEAEERIYHAWDSTGQFKADPSSSLEPFTIAIPPPNITGSLHLGHALNNTLQDILVRQKRMEGYEALYLPGTDHAGIATQGVVERELQKEGKSRLQMGREAFLQRVWEWKEKYGSAILYQLRRLGCSCDWTRTRFTLDEGYSRAVRSVFVSLFKKGFIYRGLAIVNWCPKDLTAISDLEVVHRPVAGKLWHIRYPVKGESGKWIIVATTRPETMLGDTAVAVHPGDKRYQDLMGKTLILPLLDREIPVVADGFVDPAFGTGAVKVTPAHDANDFECARRHGLKAITVMDEKAVMNEQAGPYHGLDRFECRKRVVADLESRGLLERIADHELPAAFCSRCDAQVEPTLSEQWFVRMKELAAPAIAAVKREEVKFHPGRWSKVYLDWMENIRDWCVSRQIWWGHRIPVWTCPARHAVAALETPAACPRCASRDLVQDPDVLDTWFSSALWPFATLGWPEETEDLEKFYPTQVLVTSRDIINLWVARMITSGLEFRGEKPFTDVVVHATLMNDEGQRQSKSKGTGIDPLQIIDQHGADPLRFALAWLTTGTQDIKFGNVLSVQRVEMSRNFVTKIWNAARYVSQKVDPGPVSGVPSKDLAEEDRWILSRLAGAIHGVTDTLDRYEFGEAAQILYRFVWDDFCDWYIELSKRRAGEPAAKSVLAFVMDRALRLLHPFVPFVTEEIWQKLGRPQPLIRASWPEPPPGARDPQLEDRMERVFEAVRAVREIRNRNGISPKVALTSIFSAKDTRTEALLRAGLDVIRAQANLDGAAVGVGLAKPPFAGTVLSADFTTFVALEGKIDRAAEAERCRREIAKSEAQAAQMERQIANEEFRKRKPEMAAEVDRKLESARDRLHELGAQLKDLEGT